MPGIGKAHNLLLFPLLFFFFSGCQLQKDLYGVYSLERNDIGRHDLQFHQDGRFSYSVKGSLIDSFTKGCWELDSMGFLILTSDENLKPRVAKSEEFSGDRAGIFFKIVDSEGMPLPFSSMTSVQDTSFYAVANEAGELHMDEINIRKIQISFLQEQYEYNIKLDNADSIVIYVQLRDPKFFYLENERFYVKNRKLVWNPAGLVFRMSRLDKRSLRFHTHPHSHKAPILTSRQTASAEIEKDIASNELGLKNVFHEGTCAAKIFPYEQS